jgi:hypothetical protein
MELQERVATKLQNEEREIANSSARNYAVGIISLILTVLCAFLVVHRQNPPDAQPASAPLSEFASGRAMEHLKVIAGKPHPVGSAEHAVVRDYIFKQLTDSGLRPEIQRAPVLTRRRDESYVAATVENIIGKIEGSDGGRAVLLACHYDSVPTGPGASDDGAGVAALLEVIRTLKTGPQLKNDLLFLFTDGEELGMLGAKAFMDEHPRAKDVAVALNFEARGVGGPSIMFETSEGNKWLVKEFSEVASRPVANSLTYDLYRVLGNDTDLTVFKSGGARGLNFAYISGLAYYHTARDSYTDIDERSLQHHGSYALALARRFGNVSDWPAQSSDAVYFDVFSSLFISYPKSIVLPFMALTVMCFIGLVILGLRMKRLTIGGIAFGAFGFLLNFIVVGALMLISGMAIQGMISNPMGGNYNSGVYAIGFLLLTIALSGALFIWFSKKTRVENLMAGALFWWNALMILVCLLAPGGSYLFTWPLLLMILALGTAFILREEMTSAKSIFILSLPALSGVLLIAPLIRLMISGFGMGAVWMLMTFVVFLLALYGAHLYFLISIKKWLLPMTSGLLALCFIGAGVLMSDVSAAHPKIDHIFYALNADTGKAIWGSADRKPDEWTGRFFSAGSERVSMADHFRWGRGDFLKGDAPALSLAPPGVVVLDDRRTEGLRALRLRITSPRRAAGLSVSWNPELELGSLAVDGKRVTEKNVEAGRAPIVYRRFSYYGLPEEGVELSLEVRTSGPIDLKIEDWSYGLPETPGSPYAGRPDHIIAAPILYSDCTIVTKSFTF